MQRAEFASGRIELFLQEAIWGELSWAADLLRLAGMACWWACLACLCESGARAVGLVAIYYI